MMLAGLVPYRNLVKSKVGIKQAIEEELKERGCAAATIQSFLHNDWTGMLKAWLREHEIKRVRNTNGSAGDVDNANAGFKPQSSAQFDNAE